MSRLPRTSGDVALFDLDGTLTDPIVGISRCIAYAMETLRIPLADDRDFGACIGPPLQSVFERLCGPEPELNARAIALYRERFSTVGLFENRLYDDIVPMLDGLLETRTLYVCTSKPTVYAKRILAHFAIADRFVAIYGSEFDGTHSDKSELLKYILARENIEPHRAVMVGDRKHDVVAARANAVAAVGVTWGYGSRAELEAAGADATFARPAEITFRSLADVVRKCARARETSLRPAD